MKKWLMPVLAMTFMAACGAKEEKTVSADEAAHSVVMVRVPAGVAPEQMDKAEVRALDLDTTSMDAAAIAGAFGEGDMITFNALTSDESSDEVSSESFGLGGAILLGTMLNNRNRNCYGNNCYRNNYNNNYYYNNNRWGYNRGRNCFNSGSNYYYRNKNSYNYGGYNYYPYYR